MAITTESVIRDITLMTSNQTSTMNISDEERERYLSYLDDITFPKMIPAVVYLFILMVLGIFGNILVLIVYIKKFKRSPIRVFVVSLAVFDLTTCVISLPGEMLDMRYTHTFNYPHMCRLLRFNNTFTVVSSGFTLIAVAIDRYRKICRPLQKQITIRGARMMVGVAVTVALVLTIPSIIVNGSTTVLTDRKGITGYDCSFDDRWSDTLFPLVYTGVLFLFFFGSLTVLIVMYILIGKTVFTHRRFKFKPSAESKEQSPQISTSETELSSGDGKEKPGKRWLINGGKTEQFKAKLAWISPRKSIPPAIVPTITKAREDTSDSSQSQKAEVIDTPKSKTVIFTRKSEPSQNGITLTKFSKFDNRRNSAVKVAQQSSPRASKTTLMLFIITAVFIVSFLPHLILMITRGFKSDFLESLQGGGIIVYNIFLRSYFINSAANCIVYSFCNVKFRNECKKLLIPCLNLRK